MKTQIIFKYGIKNEKKVELFKAISDIALYFCLILFSISGAIRLSFGIGEPLIKVNFADCNNQVAEVISVEK